jgi:GPH family glycoside/pentoside/hexuronide:cation symporter
VQLSNRIGKKGAYLVGLSWWVIVMVILAFLQPNQEVATYFLAISVGLGIASAHVIPSSMMPDVIEVDELATGFRREGTYYGFLVFIQKVGVAMGLALIQIVLHFTGYQPGAVQNPKTLTAIRVMIGPLPAILLCVSIFLAAKYPITKNMHTEIRNALVEKRAKAL